MRRVQRLEPPRHPEAGEAGALARARARSRRDAAGKGRSRRQSPRRALGRRLRAGGVRRGGVGGEVENPSPAIYQLRKGSLSRDAVSRLWLWSCCWGKEKREGGKKERKKERQKGMKEGESRRQDFRAGGLKSVSQSDLIQGKAMRVFI